MPLYAITHTTRYRYGQSVAASYQMLHLQPMDTASQECLHFEMHLRPRPLEITSRTDYFGNRVHYLVLTEPHRELVIEASSRVTVTPAPDGVAAFGNVSCGEAKAWLENSDESAAHHARQYRYTSPLTPLLPQITDFAREFFPAELTIGQAVHGICATIHKRFKFDPTATTVSTPLAEFFAKERGVCQDFAHLVVAALRSVGLAARYVSGYLLTEPPSGQARLLGADASHAWVSVYVPGSGWLDFDPTNDCLCGQRHITVANGRNFGDVSPVRGTVTGGGEHELYLGVTVTPSVD